MIIEGAGVCPLVKIGDSTPSGIMLEVSRQGFRVIDIICDRNIAAVCRAHKTLAMLRLDDPYKEWRIVSPTEVTIIDCNSCPVLAKDPNHFDKTKGLEELIIATGERRSSLVTEGRPKDLPASSVSAPNYIEPEPSRFELIDISEEESNEESSCNPNQK